MPSSLLTVIACSPVLVGWLAVYVCTHWSGRRRRRQRAQQREQWARLAIGLSDLDADLDRTWAQEQERIRRRP